MVKNIRVCDGCKKEGAMLFQFPEGRELDAAGDTDTVWGEFDLCHDCMYKQLSMFIKQLSYTQRAEMRKTIVYDNKLWSSK